MSSRLVRALEALHVPDYMYRTPMPGNYGDPRLSRAERKRLTGYGGGQLAVEHTVDRGVTAGESTTAPVEGLQSANPESTG